MKITQDYLSAVRLDGGFLIGVALRNGDDRYAVGLPTAETATD